MRAPALTTAVIIALLVLPTVPAVGLEGAKFDAGPHGAKLAVTLSTPHSSAPSTESRFESALERNAEGLEPFAATAVFTPIELLLAIDGDADGTDEVILQENGTLVSRRSTDGSTLWTRDRPEFVTDIFPVERPGQPADVILVTEDIVASVRDKECTGPQRGECDWHQLTSYLTRIQLVRGTDGTTLWSEDLEWTLEEEVRMHVDRTSSSATYRVKLIDAPDRIMLTSHDLVVNGGGLEVIFHETTEQIGPARKTSEGRSLQYDPRASVLSLTTGETRFDMRGEPSSGGAILWPLSNPTAPTSEFLFASADGRNDTVECLEAAFLKDCKLVLEPYTMMLTKLDHEGDVLWHLPAILPLRDAYAEPLFADLDGDGANDFALIDINQFRAHSGATGLELWRRDQAYTIPFVLGNVDGGQGIDLLAISLHGDSNETGSTWTRVGLTRVDGATGTDLFQTAWNRTHEPWEGIGIEFQLLNANDDAVLDPMLGWMRCRWSSMTHCAADTETRIEDGRSSEMLFQTEAAELVSSRPLSSIDERPGDELVQFIRQPRVPGVEGELVRIGVRDLDAALWLRTNSTPGMAVVQWLPDVQLHPAGAQSILYSLSSTEAQNVAMLDARTGATLWELRG